MSGEPTAVEPRPAIVFAPEHDVPVRYMERTREYYQALGFSPYRWAHFTDAPFTPLARPLSRARVALITTAAPFQQCIRRHGRAMGQQRRSCRVTELGDPFP